MANSLPIDEWVHQLSGIPEGEFTLPRVHDFVRGHAVRPETLAPYIVYSKGNYTRNLIYKCGVFEVLSICWEVGQVSRIHNHRDQNCWMVVPLGRLRVQNFRVENRDTGQGTCRLIPTSVYDMDPEHPAAVDPAEPVHQVLNLAEFNERAVSLHVYSKPFNSCEVYLLDKGTYFDVPLSYTTEYGKPTGEPTL